MPAVPSLQLLALLAIDPHGMVQAIQHAFAEESLASPMAAAASSSSAAATTTYTTTAQIEKDPAGTSGEDEVPTPDILDALRQLLAFAANLRSAVVEEAARRNAVADDDEELEEDPSCNEYAVGESVLITDVRTLSLRSKPIRKLDDASSGAERFLEMVEETFSRQERFKDMCRSLLGRTGIIAHHVVEHDEAAFWATYLVVVIPYAPFPASIPVDNNPLASLGIEGMPDLYPPFVPLANGKAFVAPDDSESCFGCCRTYPSQVEMLIAVHKDHRLLLCRECLDQRATPGNCYADRNCLDGIPNLFEDEAMQDLLVQHHVPKTVAMEKWGHVEDRGKFLYRIHELARMDLSCAISGCSWDQLVFCARLSRKLDNATYYHFPEMKPRRPSACNICGNVSSGISKFLHEQNNSTCTWSQLIVCPECNVTICTTCVETKKKTSRRCHSCSAIFFKDFLEDCGTCKVLGAACR